MFPSNRQIPFDGIFRIFYISFYSETTWAVGIVQLTHYMIRGGGQNPEARGQGIFAPTADRVVS